MNLSNNMSGNNTIQEGNLALLKQPDSLDNQPLVSLISGRTDDSYNLNVPSISHFDEDNE